MKGFRFYLEHDSDKEKRQNKHSGNVIAVMTDVPMFYGYDGYLHECLSAVLFNPNSPVGVGAVHPEYLKNRCKRVSEAKAREVHPELFKRLEE